LFLPFSRVVVRSDRTDAPISSVVGRCCRLTPILSPRPPHPRHRGVYVRCSQARGKDKARAWLSQLGVGRRSWGTRGRRSASPETATGFTETPASRRSVAEASLANGGFVARTRSGVFGQPKSRYGSHTLRRGFCHTSWQGFLSDPSPCYSPNLVEGAFSEVRIQRLA
jgi:hypothetical protein